MISKLTSVDEGCLPIDEISVVNEYCTPLRRVLGSATKVPLPRLRTTKPASSSEPMACRTVLRLISNLSQSSASLGSRSPTRSVPDVMVFLMMPVSCAYSGISLAIESEAFKIGFSSISASLDTNRVIPFCPIGADCITNIWYIPVPTALFPQIQQNGRKTSVFLPFCPIGKGRHAPHSKGSRQPDWAACFLMYDSQCRAKARPLRTWASGP